jgi:hypothetical protein
LTRCKCAGPETTLCCIDRDELTVCDRDLWQRFPDFKARLIEAQVKYRRQA